MYKRQPETIAKSLAIGNPAAGPYSLEVLRETGGTGVAAYEDSIIDGIRMLAETEGIFTETAGGVVISSLKRLVEQGKIKKDEVTVAFVTGNGLKATESIMQVLSKPEVMQPDVAKISAVVK